MTHVGRPHLGWVVAGLLALAGGLLRWERQQTAALLEGWPLPQLLHHEEQPLEACEPPAARDRGPRPRDHRERPHQAGRALSPLTSGGLGGFPPGRPSTAHEEALWRPPGAPPRPSPPCLW